MNYKKDFCKISKICKIQMENIEIKYNYTLMKDEIISKDEKVKNLEKQIEFRDIIIKEKIALDINNINDEEINKKHKVLLSEQQKSKNKTYTRLNNRKEIEKRNNNDGSGENTKNNDGKINLDEEKTIDVHQS